MYAVSLPPLQPRHLLASALTVALAFGVLPLAQAARHAPEMQQAPAPTQQDAASSSANGADRSIIFVGGRNHRDNTRRAAPTHPPGPCISGRTAAGDDCSLKPQPIPPGHSQHKPNRDRRVTAPVSEPAAPIEDDTGGGQP